MWRVGLLGLLLARVAAADCAITARPPVSVTVEGTTATLVFDGRTRVIEAQSCAELAKSVALVIDMVLAVPRDAPPPTTDGPDGRSPAVAPAAASDPHDKSPQPSRTLDAQTRATVVADTNDIVADAEASTPADVQHAFSIVLGTSTSLGEALTFGMRWQWDTISVSTELGGELPGGITTNADVSIVRTSAAFVPCKHVGPFSACGILRAGLDHGSGSNLMNGRSATELRSDVGARLAWEYPLTDHLAAQMRAEIDVATSASQFDVDQMAVWRSSRFAGLAGAGVVVRFP
jgi:hypothetical protein